MIDVVLYAMAQVATQRGFLSPRLREIVIEPGQVRPAPGRQLARREAAAPARRRAGDPIEIGEITLTDHLPPNGHFCDVCPDRTGTPRCNPAVTRLMVPDPDGQPRLVFACPQCATLLKKLGRILETDLLPGFA